MCKCCHPCWQRGISPGKASGAFFPNSLGTRLSSLPARCFRDPPSQATRTKSGISIPAQSLALPLPSLVAKKRPVDHCRISEPTLRS